MTRDELIEAMVTAHFDDYFSGVEDLEPPFADLPESHQDRMRSAMSAVLAAIEAQGLAIVPVEATPEMEIAGTDAGVMARPLPWASVAYAAMIAAGRI